MCRGNPIRVATSTTEKPRSRTCFTASVLNSVVYGRLMLINTSLIAMNYGNRDVYEKLAGPEINYFIFKCLTNKMPIRGLMDTFGVCGIDANNLYRRIDFFYRQCQRPESPSRSAGLRVELANDAFEKERRL